MRDGKVVQIGTAEDIVMHPADDYVADFVAGISRLKVVRAHAVMQPIEAYIWADQWPTCLLMLHAGQCKPRRLAT